MSESVLDPEKLALEEPEQLADAIASPLPVDLPVTSTHELSSTPTHSLFDYPPMPAAPEAEQIAAAYKAQLAFRRTTAAVIARGILATSASATAVGIAQIPTSVDIGPGIAADVRVQVADYSAVGYGPTTIGFPGARAHDVLGKFPLIPIHGVDVGVRLNMTRLDAQPNNQGWQAAAAIMSDAGKTLGPELQRDFAIRGAEGIGAGLLVYGGGELLAFALRRRRQAEAATAKRQLEHLKSIDNLLQDKFPGNGDTTDAQPETALDPVAALRETNQSELAALKAKLQRIEKPTLRRKVAAVVAGLGIFATSAAGLYHEGDALTPSRASSTSFLSQVSNNPYVRELIEQEPILKDMFVTGYLGKVGEEGLVEASKQIERVIEYWQDQANELVNVVLPEFLANNDLSDLLNNPDWVIFGDVTDVHDNRAYMQYYLPVVLKALVHYLHIQFLADTGDQENFSDESVLDNGAQQRVADALPATPAGSPLPVTYSAGNHDPKNSKRARQATTKIAGKKYHSIIPLDEKNGYTTVINGLPVVGSPDLNRTTGPHDTTPSDPEAQIANDAKQGRLLAKAACAAFKQYGIKPVVEAHEPAAGYAAVASGCASIVLSGHWHQEHSEAVYSNADGSFTVHEIQGSGSGDGQNNPTAMFNKATTTGYTSVWFRNKVTGEVRQLRITIDPNGGLPTIGFVTQPRPETAQKAIENPDIYKFAQKYDKSLLNPQPTTDTAAAGTHPK